MTEWDSKFDLQLLYESGSLSDYPSRSFSEVCAFVLSHLDYCNALLACSAKHLIEKLQNVKIMLLDSSSVAPNLIMSPLSFIACTGSLSIWESTTRFLLSVSKFWNQLRPLTSLISYMFTLPPGSFVLYLMINFSVYLTLEQSWMANTLLLIRELTPGTSSHSLFGIHSL